MGGWVHSYLLHDTGLQHKKLNQVGYNQILREGPTAAAAVIFRSRFRCPPPFSPSHRNIRALHLLYELPPRGQANFVVFPGVKTPDVTSAQHVDQRSHLLALTTSRRRYFIVVLST